MHLLAQAFLLVLGFDDATRNRRIVCLATDSIELAENFLANEIELSAAFRFAETGFKLGKMAVEARQFFRDIAAIGKKRHFLEKARIVQVDFQAERRQTCTQGIAMRFDRADRSFANLRRPIAQTSQAHVLSAVTTPTSLI